MKRIAVINGHPYPGSLCQGLMDAYVEGARSSGAEVRTIELGKLNFNPNLMYGYSKRMELEEDLLAAQDTMKWAEHLVFVYPTWWGTMPAIMKGFFDRTFLPGYSYKTEPNSLLQKKLLGGRTARLIVTMDTPHWYYRWILKQAGHHIMKRSILGFCGIAPVRITEIGPVKTSSESLRQGWLKEAQRLGARLA
ncbi:MULTISPECIES: NAD(P)H-dependent oxidoreductase [Paenibacillus]|uniref:NAD(P)H-dependent oxidoreductase n=1 Tax=Paenibacillus TaxID=44249 RepID=UPI000837DB96|nr:MULTISPECIES: NAD(P)H-dependent oxidoreductase [Paenibacillus]GIP22065.1 NAD(P)H dehydrogenase (quinone) [Paenibacillus sp. J22TS3]